MAHQAPTDETLADLLDDWAKREGLNDSDIASALGYSAPAILHWRKNHSTPVAKKWPLIAKLSGRTIEEVACAIARGVKPVPRRRHTATVTTRTGM